MPATNTLSVTPPVPTLALLHILDTLGKTDAILSPAHVALHAMGRGHSLATSLALGRRVDALIALICHPAWPQLAAWRNGLSNPQQRLDAELVIIAVVADAPLYGSRFAVPEVLRLVARFSDDSPKLPKFEPSAHFGI